MTYAQRTLMQELGTSASCTHLMMALRAASIAWLASCAGVSSADSSPTASGGVNRQLPGEPDLQQHRHRQKGSAISNHLCTRGIQMCYNM